MQVSHVNKNMVKQSSTVPISQSIKVLKPNLGLDLIDPRSSTVLFPFCFLLSAVLFIHVQSSLTPGFVSKVAAVASSG